MRLAIVAVLLISIAPAFAQDRLPGTWIGKLEQNVGSSGYDLVLILGEEGGKSHYPALDCGGTWTRVGASGDHIFFVERIAYGRLDQGGRCVDGTFTVAVADGSLAVGWFGVHQGKALVAWGLLKPKP
jgi:hypothetical protein